jgi:hypothetical protein
MKTLLFLLIVFPTLCFGGWTWVTIIGELYSEWVSSDGRWLSLDGPGGFHADGFRWSNGNIDWTVNPGWCHRP